ncbi:EF1G factor, partial [Myiagra hebetior]|nr:EF1G factor [Myiagra hebetior]
EFLGVSPQTQVPAFEGDDGFCVFESNAIAYYVSTEELRGSTPEAAAAVLQWVNFADSDVVPPASTWVFPTLGILHYNKQATEVAKEEVKRVLGVLDGHLKTRRFVFTVGQFGVTLVGFGVTLRGFRVTVGQFGVTLGQFGVPPGVLSVPRVPSAPSPFVLDEFKRKYSNEDTLGVALPHFWEHFDREGWSLWYCQYRYPEELSQTFMSCNLITGMFQRLDKLRKNAFASVVLFGSDHDSSISGVWVMRGQELAFTLCPDWQVDYESYTWRKLDPDSAECRTLVTEYFLWEGEFRHVGKPFNQGKIFK